MSIYAATDSSNRQQQALEFILSSEHVRKEKAKIQKNSFIIVAKAKKLLRKIGLFNSAKNFINRTNWWRSHHDNLATKWGTDVAGGVYFYQSFPMLNIKGNRPTDLRIKTYGLYDVLDKSMNVLDIGSNVGFFDMTIAEHVNSITGIEYDKDFADIAAGTAKILGLDNVTFINADANQWLKNNMNNRYSLILSFAVHCWLNVKAEDYAQIISELLLPRGFLVFESHGIGDGEEFTAAFLKHGLKKLRGGTADNLDPAPNYNRMWAVFHKPGA